MNKYKCCKEAIVKYYLEGASILSVEQGSIKSNPNNPVIAFTVETEGEKNIKCIVKGKQAKIIYNFFLKEGFTKPKTVTTDSITVAKTCRVSFTGIFKEERKNEIVLHQLTDVSFNFNYLIENE